MFLVLVVFPWLIREIFQIIKIFRLRKLGYSKIHLTPKVGDYGIDVLALSPNGKKVGFQCKRYKNNVDNKAVQEAYSGKTYYQLEDVYVVTNSHYTQQAIKTGKANKVILLDREDLLKLIRSANKKSESKRELD